MPGGGAPALPDGLTVRAEHGGERRGDLELEQHEVFIPGKAGAGIGDLAGAGVVVGVGDAVDVELMQVPGLVAGGRAVKYVAAIAAQVVPLGRGRFHEQEQSVSGDDGTYRMQPRRAVWLHGGQVGDLVMQVRRSESGQVDGVRG